jgi:NADH-quinone oxidoreductase subunit H
MTFAALLQPSGSPVPPSPVLPSWSPVELIVDAGVPRFAAEYLIWPAVQLAIIFFVILTVVAYLVYLERKVSAFMQARLGPMRVGPWGLLQPLADGVKLLTKEDFVPDAADRGVFFMAPVLAVTIALGLLAVVPFGAAWATVADLDIGLLFVLAVSSVGVFGIVLAGWASNSKYALLGAVRSTAQLISYEVAVGLAVVGPLFFARSLSLGEIIEAQRYTGVWYVLFQPLAFAIFFVGALAETNRAPFDLPESEQELVAGFHVEYSGFRWALFFMAEYTNVIITSAIAITVFLGGWWVPGLETAVGWIAGSSPDTVAYSIVFTVASILVFSVKLLVLIYAVMWIRWTLPRYRYDQLMDLGWKWLIPAALANILVTAFFYVVALEQKTANGQGWLMQVDPNGIWLSAPGYIYFLATAAVTVVVAWLVLAAINSRTSDFNLHARRQLQVRLRAERLAKQDS